MKVPLNTQKIIRERMLASIDIDQVQYLVDDYSKLSELLSQTLDELFNNNDYKLTTQDQKK
ncbi:type II/IV secretion system ATP hydrolase TadA/VirB11/CpaF, TadA subfamily [Yersinia enterocolitica subsp. palearctica Y11]|nr:type II/IV secretion system ATP hydrolase TadA/VirB11/CpaF, TadA subfamily [Yersinia enterocolitica subsp. palearctica Y11]